KWNFMGADLTHVTEDATEFQTVAFSLFACLAIFNALNCREFGIVSIIPNFFKNKLVLKVLGFTLGVQILVTQLAGGFFHTVPLSLGMWTKIIVVGASVVVVNELVKTALRMINISRKKARKQTKVVQVIK
ncbi:MAG: cation transporting ATPase C-terminal domain-containing protein, partial [Turicibacter sp.]